jgi:TetR/AcrR family transcriptional regulator
VSSDRRIGAEDSKSRAALLDAALALMLEEGYASVTSRRVAARAGLKPQLVHYYFRTMDDLFLALFRQGADRNRERHAEALAADQPLWALWAFSNEPAGTALYIEFTALANHRKTIRAEIAAYAERFRQQQLEALAPVLAAHGVDPDELPPVAVLVLMTAVSRIVAMEEGLGMSLGHAETHAMVERYLTDLEGPRREPGRTDDR